MGINLGSLITAGAKGYAGYLQGQHAGEQAKRERDREDEDRKRRIEQDALQRVLTMAQLSAHGVHQGTAPGTAPLDVDLTGLPGGTAQHVDLPGSTRYEQLTPQFYQDEAPRREAQQRQSASALLDAALKRSQINKNNREPAPREVSPHTLELTHRVRAKRYIEAAGGDVERAAETAESEGIEIPRSALDAAAYEYRHQPAGRQPRAGATDPEHEEAIGLGYLNTPVPPEQQKALAEAFNGIRAQHPDWKPGRVAFHAHKAVAAARPDLTEPKQRIPGKVDPVRAQIAEVIAEARRRAAGGGAGVHNGQAPGRSLGADRAAPPAPVATGAAGERVMYDNAVRAIQGSALPPEEKRRRVAAATVRYRQRTAAAGGE